MLCYTMLGYDILYYAMVCYLKYQISILGYQKLLRGINNIIGFSGVTVRTLYGINKIMENVLKHLQKFK